MNVLRICWNGPEIKNDDTRMKITRTIEKMIKSTAALNHLHVGERFSFRDNPELERLFDTEEHDPYIQITEITHVYRGEMYLGVDVVVSII